MPTFILRGTLSHSPPSSPDEIEGKLVQITRARQSGRGPDYVAFVFVSLGVKFCVLTS
jgi:hypothetical protein